MRACLLSGLESGQLEEQLCRDIDDGIKMKW
jgi:hypothetical protein